MNSLFVLCLIAIACSSGLAIRQYGSRNTGSLFGGPRGGKPRGGEPRGGGPKDGWPKDGHPTLLKSLGVHENERTLYIPLRFGAASIILELKPSRKENRSRAARCLPNAFQMPIRQTTVVSKGPRTVFVRAEISVAVDSNRQLAAFNQSVWEDSRLKFRSSAVIDVANQTVYVFDQKRSCSRSKKMQGIKLNLCLPETSKRISSVVLGAGATQTGLLVDVWEVPTAAAKIKAFLVATQRDFTPVSETVVVASPKGREAVSAFQESGFFNFTLGIKDPSVFTVPPPCRSPESTPSPHRCHGEDCAPEW